MWALDADDSSEPAVDPDRFQGPDGRWPGNWVSFPRSWDEIPEEQLLSEETRIHIQRAIDALPPNQEASYGCRCVPGRTAGKRSVAGVVGVAGVAGVAGVIL